MKRVVFGLMVILSMAALANAAITGYSCDDDHDGVIVMQSTAMDPPLGGTDVTLTMYCTQPKFAEGNVVGDFSTDTELDPTVRLTEFITNDTNYDWTGYNFSIRMSKTFTISAPVMPKDWTYVITQAPASVPSGEYVGSVVFSKGTGSAVKVGDEANFGFKMQFLGAVSYCTAQTPVPEPVSIVMLALGGFALTQIRRSRR
jgi:hypothetical protein